VTLVARAPARPVLVLAGVVVLVLGLNVALRHGGYATTLRYLRMAAADQATADSWRPMLRALDAWDAGQPIYQQVFFVDHVKFQYPLTSLLFPLALRSDIRRDVPLMKALNHVSLAIYATLTLAVLALFRLVWCRDLPDEPRWPLWVGLAAAAITPLLFYPAVMSYVLGQIQTIVNASVAVALAAWVAGRRRTAGVALAVAALVKPHVALFLVWGILRRQWSFTAAFLVTTALGVAIALAVFGWRNNVDYLRVVSFMAARGEAFQPNQTVNGLLNRLVQPPEERAWSFSRFPPPDAVVRTGTIAAALILLGLALTLPFRLGFAGSATDLAIMALSITMASPIAWDHHYGVLCPMYMLAGGLLARAPAVHPWLVLGLLVSALLTGLSWGPLIEIDAVPWNIVQSYVLAGAIVSLIVLYRVGSIARPWAALSGA
jgi:alpha-1,2-mannosyltransferase